MAKDERRKMSSRREGGNSGKLVVLFYIDAPPLKYSFHQPSPIIPPILQQHLTHFPLLRIAACYGFACTSLVAAAGGEYILFIN